MSKKEIEKLKEQVFKEIEKSKMNEESKDFSVQVTSINGVQSTIHLQNIEAFVKLKGETQHQSFKHYRGKSKLLKTNKTLIELLYIQRFFRILHEDFGISVPTGNLSPCAMTEIISVLLDHKKRKVRSRDETKFYQVHSNKTLAYSHFFQMFYAPDANLDARKYMQILANLSKENEVICQRRKLNRKNHTFVASTVGVRE